MLHARQPEPVGFPISLIRGMPAMLLEAKVSITSSLTDISIVILSDSPRDKKRASQTVCVQHKRIRERAISAGLSVDERWTWLRRAAQLIKNPPKNSRDHRLASAVN